MTSKYPHLWAFLRSTVWAIQPEKLQEILAALELKEQGVDIDFEAAARPAPQTGRGIAVLPLWGTISQRANLMTENSGGTSLERFTKMFRGAVRDPEVGTVILDVDSPGGSVFGVEELSSEIFEAREQKRIVAVSDSLAASAAYWLGSSASEFVITPSGEVGSIGVFAMHEDISEMAAMAGVKVSFISAGKYKTEGNEFEPLGDDARGYMQKRVNDYYDSFVKAVARNRGVKVGDVRDGFGEGRVVGAKDALKGGMVDRIATLDDTITRYLPKSSAPARSTESMRQRLRIAEAGY